MKPLLCLILKTTEAEATIERYSKNSRSVIVLYLLKMPVQEFTLE